MKPPLTICVGLGVLAALVAWLFAPALSGQGVFAFRDAAHFYRPLFEFESQEWRAGRAPLWNPYENIGVPLVGQGTSSLFYPGKLVFALPLDVGLSYNLYIVAHVLLAAATSYALARHWHASVFGSSLAALSYALGGSVLFQIYNVVFLVGAAWLPLGLLLADRALRRRSTAAAAGFGVVQALVILGGDAEMAYNVALVVALLAVLVGRAERREATAEARRVAWHERRPALLGLALVVTALVAAVQILPSWEASSRSPRAYYDSPRNVYELASAALLRADESPGAGRYDGLLGRITGGHERQVYQFSVAPWRAVELMWPNVTGQAFPTNRRWLVPAGIETSAWDLWTPSLYLGLLPVVLAATAWSVRRRAAVETRFLSWVVVLSGAASLGVFGAVWLARQFSDSADLAELGDEVGGLYWAMTVLLPKYVDFRYPAKWLVIGNLAVSLLAALGWDAAWREGRRLTFAWATLAAISVGGMAAAWLAWSRLEAFGADLPPTTILGPFDWPGAQRDVLAAGAQTAILAGLLWALFRLGKTSPRRLAYCQAAAIVVTGLDLAVAQRCLMVYAPAEIWQQPPAVLAELPVDITHYRVYRSRGLTPSGWEQSFSAGRFTECVAWDRATLLPKYGLPYQVAMVEASETLGSADYRALVEQAREEGRRQGHLLPDGAILDLLAVRGAIVTPRAREEIDGASMMGDAALIGTRPHALPRTWIVHRVEVVSPFHGRSRAALGRFTNEVLFDGGQSHDWSRVAVVETDEPLEFEPRGREPAAAERCAIVRADPLQVEIEAELAAEGLVVLSDLHYPGWRLRVETAGEVRDVPILRTNRAMRGALLPAGQHRLVYRYRPLSVIAGGAASGLAVVGLVIAAIVGVVRRQSQRGRQAMPPAGELTFDFVDKSRVESEGKPTDEPRSES